jgi:hypothetical protein
MLAIISIQEKKTPIDIPVNPIVSIDCPSGYPLSSKQYSDGQIMSILSWAKLNLPDFSFRRARLAVVNYHVVKFGFRLIGTPAIIYSNDKNPVFEYYMEMPLVNPEDGA